MTNGVMGPGPLQYNFWGKVTKAPRISEKTINSVEVVHLRKHGFLETLSSTVVGAKP